MKKPTNVGFFVMLYFQYSRFLKDYIEERAVELGLEKMDNKQVSYYKVEDNNGIKVKESPIKKSHGNSLFFY